MNDKKLNKIASLIKELNQVGQENKEKVTTPVKVNPQIEIIQKRIKMLQDQIDKLNMQLDRLQPKESKKTKGKLIVPDNTKIASGYDGGSISESIKRAAMINDMVKLDAPDYQEKDIPAPNINKANINNKKALSLF